ncbi:hypothetical protein [Cypionkella sp.]|uniref:hypothetical protein n=1 Tax=Cypionkella sp. TaxID=2811411 RepID=UPI002FDF00FA
MQELPYQTVKAALVLAAQHAGHSMEIAAALAQSAWWLENRGVAGVDLVIAYLEASRKLRPSDLGAKRDDYGSLRCICPIAAAAAVIAERDILLSEGGEVAAEGVEYGLFGGPASPMVMGAILAFYGDDQGLGVRLRFGEQVVVLCKAFLCHEEGWAAGLVQLDVEASVGTDVEFVDLSRYQPIGRIVAFERQMMLKLPSNRMGENGTLHLI